MSSVLERAALLSIVRTLALGCGVASITQAAPQVGTVIASEPFELKGARVTAAGVPSWPVSAGDEIATENWPVLFQFPDGSQITLEPNSRARVEGTKRNPVFRLLDCTADYHLKRMSSVAIYRNEQIERISKVDGKSTVGCHAAGTAAAGAAGAGAASAGAATAGAASAGAASAGAASVGAATAGVASATAATAGVASAATIGASAAAAAGVATSVGVAASNAGALPPVSP
jgi:hypothetical protein